MKKLWKCGVCGFTMEGIEPPEVCPNCGSPGSKYAELSEEAAKKVYDSYVTNDIHMELVTLAERMIHLSRKGIDINLDPNCLAIFKKTEAKCYIIKEMSKAEIAAHVSKGKW
ncbi:rubredoxin-like domain-containing protein [Acetobacterium sp.]|uniref:rubredoxin-like domain-containing protein n=1 Tax=Acetobacterium sp. TaxID=1872094 RepID=UPI002F3E3DD4